MPHARSLALLLTLRDGTIHTFDSLASRLGTSRRTVIREVDALSSDGVPLRTHRGRDGGVSLDPGWKQPTPALTRREAQALATLAHPGPLAALDLAAPLRDAVLKLVDALPDLQRHAAEHARQRLYVDTSAWFDPPDTTAALPVLRDACWTDQRVRLDYRDFDGRPSTRTVDPLGLVVKGDRWYLVARDGDDLKSFRGSRITRVRVLPDRFVRPPRFDLATHWPRVSKEFQRKRARYVVRLRASAEARDRLLAQRPGTEHAHIRRAKTVTIDFERESIAVATLALAAPGIEVVSPDALRLRLLETGRALTSPHGSPRATPPATARRSRHARR